jgi:hypothetical protein
MNLFRSEEHVQRWLDGREPGATIPVETLWRLAHAWYRDRLAPEWRPRTADENREILRSLGLTGPFWSL